MTIPQRRNPHYIYKLRSTKYINVCYVARPQDYLYLDGQKENNVNTYDLHIDKCKIIFKKI